MLLIVSGLSGAGKSTALHALEDMGVFCTDNLPAEMLLEWAERMQDQDAAVCIDMRSSANSDELYATLKDVCRDKTWQLLFIDANDQSLQRRFSTVRRRHPTVPETDLGKAIIQERKALSPLRDLSDLVLDSSNLNPYELADLVESFWRNRSDMGDDQEGLICSIVSFSYQRGLPTEADMVIDMRYLPNPHYEVNLAPLTGQDQEVKDFFGHLPEISESKTRLQDWMMFIWPQLVKERKRYFTLAIGCSGGRHRSVYMAEHIAAWMSDQGLADPMLRHRELKRVMK
ncbi:MAG: RNase adapter RapZ [Mariprofundaceae bacterium]